MQKKEGCTVMEDNVAEKIIPSENEELEGLTREERRKITRKTTLFDIFSYILVAIIITGSIVTYLIGTSPHFVKLIKSF